ncbi:IMP-specific 5'-nucleotidase 1 [Coccomyxa sp. Obi]|nr:IMP-specific 5'-nucleotidase 1 [Coccomyxa sp. Obi]
MTASPSKLRLHTIGCTQRRCHHKFKLETRAWTTPSVDNLSGSWHVPGLRPSKGLQRTIKVQASKQPAASSGNAAMSVPGVAPGHAAKMQAGPASTSSDSKQPQQSVGPSKEARQTSSEGASSSGREYWQELLNVPETDGGVLGARARSASDASVLRRKGHLKEQDLLIEFLLSMHHTHTSLEAMQKLERWIKEHRQDPKRSRLKRMVPSVGSFFTPLKLVEAFNEYDEFFALSRRRYISPNFAEMRHVLNIAQVHSSAKGLRLVTFDADGTLYADGCHMEHDNEMVGHIISLMRSNIDVAIVTAAGYPGEPERFEQRVEGLLAAFRRLKLPAEITDRFHIMGGECNYVLRVARPDMRLQFVPDEDWKSPAMMSWAADDIARLLSDAERVLTETAHRLRLPVTVVRKERAVGVVPQVPTVYEVLEEMAITVQHVLLDSPTPFCAFNGGNDVFVDVGNKSFGLEALMNYLGLTPSEVLHVGDRFTASGNDAKTRDCCSILWVANPEETDFFIKLLLADLRRLREQPYIE